MNAKQTALVNDLKVSIKAEEIVNQIANHYRASLQASEAASSADHLPPLVEEYFDKRGDEGVWKDRLGELMDAWADGVNERAFIADRGDPLEVSDEDFHSSYEGRKTYIERELEDAVREAERLKERCRDAGYDVEQYRTARRSETASDAFEPLLAPQHPFSETYVQDELSSDVDPTEPQPSERRIDTWLRAVSPDDNEPAGDPTVQWPAPETALLPDGNAAEQCLPLNEMEPEVGPITSTETGPTRSSALATVVETDQRISPHSTAASATQSYSIRNL